MAKTNTNKSSGPSKSSKSTRAKTFRERSDKKFDERLRHKTRKNKNEEQRNKARSEKQQMHDRKLETVDKAIYAGTSLGQGTTIADAAVAGSNSNDILSSTGLPEKEESKDNGREGNLG